MTPFSFSPLAPEQFCGALIPGLVDALDEVVIEAVTAEGDVAGVWRSWRYPDRKRVYLVQAGLEESDTLDAIAPAARSALRAAGEVDPEVEVFADPTALPAYHRFAFVASMLLWVRPTGAIELVPLFAATAEGAEPGFAKDHATIADDERDRLVEYLQLGLPILASPGFAVDVVEPVRGAAVPLTFRTDGRWIWSDAATYYLREYGLAPADDDFLSGLSEADYERTRIDLGTVHRTLGRVAATSPSGLPPYGDLFADVPVVGEFNAIPAAVATEPEPDLDLTTLGVRTAAGWAATDEGTVTLVPVPGVFVVEVSLSGDAFQVGLHSLPASALATLIAEHSADPDDMVLLAPTGVVLAGEAVHSFAAAVAANLGRPVVAADDLLWFNAAGSIATGGRFWRHAADDSPVADLGPILPVPAGFGPDGARMRLDLYRTELASLVGLAEVKPTVEALCAAWPGHLALCGPAGTGKTTVAWLIGQMLAATNALASGHLVRLTAVEIEEDGVAAVEAAVNQAVDGVLLIEDAYRMALTGGDTDLVDRLLALTIDRRDLVLVLTGHEPEIEIFLAGNQALSDQISQRLSFPSLGTEELVQVFQRLVQRAGLTCTESALDAAHLAFDAVQRSRNFDHGHFARQLLEEAMTRQRNRLSDSTARGLHRVLEAEDIAV